MAKGMEMGDPMLGICSGISSSVILRHAHVKLLDKQDKLVINNGNK